MRACGACYFITFTSDVPLGRPKPPLETRLQQRNIAKKVSCSTSHLENCVLVFFLLAGLLFSFSFVLRRQPVVRASSSKCVLASFLMTLMSSSFTLIDRVVVLLVAILVPLQFFSQRGNPLLHCHILLPSDSGVPSVCARGGETHQLVVHLGRAGLVRRWRGSRLWPGL